MPAQARGTSLGLSPTDTLLPAPPRLFQVANMGGGTWRATWQDTGGAYADRVLGQAVSNWLVKYVTAASAGSPSFGFSTDFAWRIRVATLAHTIGSVASHGDGGIIEFTYSDATLGDIYVLVQGVNLQVGPGIPSEPLLVLQGANTGPPGMVTNVGIALTDLTDAYGNAFVRLNATYQAPATLGNFYGVELTATNYLGSSDPTQIGNPIVYPYTTPGGLGKGSVTVPKDTAHVVDVYFNSVGRDGTRLDYTTTPSVHFAGGFP